MRLGKGHARRREPVDIRRGDFAAPAAQAMHVAIAEVVGEDVDDVGLGWLVIGGMQDGQRSQQQCGENKAGGVHSRYFLRVSNRC